MSLIRETARQGNLSKRFIRFLYQLFRQGDAALQYVMMRTAAERNLETSREVAFTQLQADRKLFHGERNAQVHLDLHLNAFRLPGC